MAGVILPQETFGSHLDNSGNTIDIDLEEKNFMAAADIISDIWSKTVIDVQCEAVKKGSEFIPEEASAKWLSQ